MVISAEIYLEKYRNKKLEELKKELEEAVLLKDRNILEGDQIVNVDTKIGVLRGMIAKKTNRSLIEKTTVSKIIGAKHHNPEYFKKLAYLLKIDSYLELNYSVLEDIRATYYNSNSNGRQLFIDSNDNYLDGLADESFERLKNDFIKGKRHGNLNDLVTDKVVKLTCHTCGTRIEVDCSKFPDNIKTLDTMCPKCKTMIKYANINYKEKEENLDINKALKQAKKLMFGPNKKLDMAKEILLNLVSKDPKRKDENPKLYNFDGVVDFMIYTQMNKNENIKWIDTPYASIYNYLAYIYNEENNYQESLKMSYKSLEWYPLSIISLSEISETYKSQKNWPKFLESTMNMYDKVYSPISLARFYRNLGFYYVEQNKLELAYSLYLISLKYDKNKNAYSEMEYIKRLLSKPSFSMSYEKAIMIIEENNLPIGAKKENIDQLIEIYVREKEMLTKTKNIMNITKLIYGLTKDQNFSPYIEKVDRKTGCSIIIPRIWNSMRDDVKNKLYGDKQMFIIKTDYDATFQGVCYGKYRPELFEQLYINSVKQIVENSRVRAKLLAENTLNLPLAQGQKIFKQALVELVDKKILMMHNFTMINNFLVDFSMTLDKNIKYQDRVSFNNQVNLIDLNTILSSIVELPLNPPKLAENSNNDQINSPSNSKDAKMVIPPVPTLSINPKTYEIIGTDLNGNYKLYSLVFMDTIKINIEMPRILGEPVKKDQFTYLFGDTLVVMNDKCPNIEALHRRANAWLDNSSQLNGQIILDDLDREYQLGDDLLVYEKVVAKDSHKRYYKFIYIQGSMLILAFDDMNLNRTVDKIIASIKIEKDV